MTDKKYCSQCAYCVPSKNFIPEVESLRYSRCSHPLALIVRSPGDAFVSPLLDVQEQRYCSGMRASEDCSAAAHLFEARVEAAA